jgi:hypothetical protein
MNGEFRRRLRGASRAVPLAIESEGLERQVHQIDRFPTDIAHSCDLPRLKTSFSGHIISSPASFVLAGSRRYHNGIDLAENDVDATGNTWHDRACGHGNEAGHESVLDEILSTSIVAKSGYELIKKLHTSSIRM